jgi:hypothetical protein
MDKPLNEVAFTATFLSQAAEEGMTQDEMTALSLMLAANPEAGELIVGSGGCRKVRLAGKGRGKSGGYRTATFFAPRYDMPVYVFAVLAKGSRANFSAEEIANMAKLSKAILSRLKPKAAS